MNPTATYSFLPWLRQGIANTITVADGDASVKIRASINVTLQLSGDPVDGGGPELTKPVRRDIALYGPGDIVGIDTNCIFRTDPHPWITNFEPNYLAAVEFYDEDFPWRYTPAAPDGTGLRLRPWIALVVLEETEFTEGQNALDRPLPYITVPDVTVFPQADELWAWAHVHFNESVAGSATELVSPDMGAVLPRVQAILAGNPDLAYGRLICPRRLGENSGYHAFVVPTFETGRLAGLGHDPAAAPHATFSAWGLYGGKLEPTSIPIYYRWYFRTGSKGDFEYLVSLLKPRPIDTRVGTRDIDVQDPGTNIPGINNPALGGVLRLGGALRVPDADLSPPDLALRQKYENWDQPYPHPFQQALAAFINLADDYSAQSATAANTASGLGPGVSDDPDPLITAPLYGRWHALTQRLLTNRDGTRAPDSTNWVHKLNLDPRFRVAAGLGADVVEENAEEYMNDAWQQVGDVLAANQRIRQLHLATDVSTRWFVRHLTPLASANAEHAFTLAAPVAGRVLVANSTIAYTQSASLVPPVVTSTALRRVLRPGARLMRSLPFNAAVTPGNLLARINSGAVSAAPPKAVPTGLPTVDQAGGAAHPSGVPSWLLQLLEQNRWLIYSVLALALLLSVILLLVLALPAALVAVTVVVVALVALYAFLQGLQTADDLAQSLGEVNQVPSSVAQMPDNPTFVLTDPGSSFAPATGTIDSPTAVRFKDALRDWYALRVASHTAAQRPQPTVLDLPGLTSAVVAALNPQVAIPRRGVSFISIPSWIRQLIGDEFNEVMAYPKIDLPMYDPLKAISIELFLPNINLIAPNSITLIETNQKFIESYMVGLNHEFARKLLWRGFPTDLRGSYFRQFWDVRSYIDSEGLSEDPLKEKLYDIPELHRWRPTSNLGDHNNRASAGETGEEAVLVIRGELLKKYPTAVIFAQHAKWALKNGKIDPTQSRSLDDLTPAEEQNPPRSKIRSPLYEAKADPDIYFFGFDLTVPEAKGQSGQNPGDDAGWFFVIKERPGEPRFGLEISRTGPPKVFDQVTWDDALPGGGPGEFLPATSLAHVALTTPPSTDPEFVQNADDQTVNAAPPSSARWAYLLFRAAVMVAVHADEMLR
jgi:hypothetical protein